MILIEATKKWAGYDPRELKKWSTKRVCCACDICGRVKWKPFGMYRDLCRSCGTKMGKHPPTRTAEHCNNISKSLKGKKRQPRTDEWKRNQSIFMTNRIVTEETRQHMSAGQQGIPYEDWIGFSEPGEYCELFNEACRERIRAKYNHQCFFCDKHQDENITKGGKQRKLAVHHADKNRGQGCNGIVWKLVPLCMSCHGKSHYEPVQSRIEYILADEE